MKTVQQKRQATMKRLSNAASKPYDARKHRRAVYVAVKYQRELLGDDMPNDLARKLMGMTPHFTHRRFKGAHAA